MRDLISGLDALHRHEILHLDIKPENILFDGHGADAHIKITGNVNRIRNIIYF
jgi:serine/threonine protein kinase